jgi:hypothetical protein
MKLKRKAPERGARSTATTPIPFAENRYRKYRFQGESIVREAPESSGVYGLYSALWIFIGDAENIRARLLEHLAGDNSCINRHQPSGFAFELASPEARGRRREELTIELEPVCRGEPSHVAPARDTGPDVSVSASYVSALSGRPKFGSEADE